MILCLLSIRRKGTADKKGQSVDGENILENKCPCFCGCMQDVEAGFATRSFQPQTSGRDQQDWEFEIVSFPFLCNVDGDDHY